jgi:hypothetical protein
MVFGNEDGIRIGQFGLKNQGDPLVSIRVTGIRLYLGMFWKKSG